MLIQILDGIIMFSSGGGSPQHFAKFYQNAYYICIFFHALLRRLPIMQIKFRLKFKGVCAKC